MTAKYGFSKKVGYSYEAALKRVIEELKKEGFGILTEIDFKATMKEKLEAELKPYMILGACNPPFTYKALQKEKEIGLMLPCNVIVYVDDDDKTVVSAVDPVASMQAVENPDLATIANQIQQKLRSVIQSL